MVHSAPVAGLFVGFRKVCVYRRLLRSGGNDAGQAGDGVYATSEGGYIRLVDLKSNKTRDLVAMTDATDVSAHQAALYASL